MQPRRGGAFEEIAVSPYFRLVCGRPTGFEGRSVYARSELPTNFGFFAVSAGFRGMCARQDLIHFPSADVWSQVRVTCDALKKQDLLHMPFR